jgi:DNA invertase Pin-like site-specific DNA recombinase
MKAKRRRHGDGLVEIADGTVYALGYGRVSTDEQALGLSLDAQRADRLRYIQAQGWIPYRDFEDVMAGRRDDRPDYQALLGTARRLRDDGKAVAIVVSDLDRLGRKLGEQIRARDEMRGLDVPIVFVRQGGELDDLTADMLGAVAANESRKLSQRVKNVRRHVRTGGWHTPGRPAWGYLWRDATIDERRRGAPPRVYDLDPQRAPLAREALEAVANGALTPRGVIVWMGGLTEEQRGGRAFDFRAARLMLSAAVYVSRHEQPVDAPVLERPRCNWPALISDETYAAIQARLEARSRVPARYGVTYLLTGFLRCHRCGSRMAGWLQSRYGRQYRRYRCYGLQHNGRAVDRGCSAVADAAQIEQAVIAAVRDVAAVAVDRRIREGLERAWAQLSAGEREDTAGRQRIARGLRAQVAQGRARIDKAVTLYLDGKLEEDDYRRAREQETAKIEAAERELAAMGEATDRRRPSLPPLTDVLRDAGGWGAILAGTDIEAQRNILADLVERVVPERVGYGKYEARIEWTPLGKALRKLRRPSPSMRLLQ